MKKAAECYGKIELINPSFICANPSQPRKTYDTEKINGLVQSIRKNGIITPLRVRKLDKNKFELIYGHRRLLAANILNLETVPCLIADSSNEQSCIYSLIENIQREKLSFFEEAVGIYKLMSKYNLTQCEVSLKLGMSQPTLANKLRLLKLSKLQQERIVKHSLTERHARALIRLDDEIDREKALDEIIVRGLNVDQTDKLIDSMKSPSVTAPKKKFIVNDIRLFVNSINKAITVMKTSGINAQSRRQEDEDFIKYTVLIPKK